jgi:hypothetical protein
MEKLLNEKHGKRKLWAFGAKSFLTIMWNKLERFSKIRILCSLTCPIRANRCPTGVVST